MQAENARNEEKASKLRLARAEEKAASQKSLNIGSAELQGRVNSPVARRSLFTEKATDSDSSSHGRRVSLSKEMHNTLRIREHYSFIKENSLGFLHSELRKS